MQPPTRRQPGNIARTIRRRIESHPDRLWTSADFAGLPGAAVGATLSRLARAGALQRIRPGLYYRPRLTIVGPSRPSAQSIAAKKLSEAPQPAGLTAASTLGLTTQNPGRLELAVTRGSVTSALNAEVHVRRPASRRGLSAKEAAILEVLRDRGKASDLNATDTIRRVAQLLKEAKTFDRLAKAAKDEPPRVRAMLGALGETIGESDRQLARLRRTLNPTSKFDFALFRALPNARAWQAK